MLRLCSCKMCINYHETLARSLRHVDSLSTIYLFLYIAVPPSSLDRYQPPTFKCTHDFPKAPRDHGLGRRASVERVEHAQQLQRRHCFKLEALEA